jgi:anti-sigma factor RsiW
VLAERPRPEVADSLGVSEPELRALLAEARKELRQTILVLGGTGWCERAERLISDRLDGALADRDVGRLDVHLRNCPRCVEHERRLVQATDALVTGLGSPARPAPGAAAPTPLVEAPPPDAGTQESAPEAPAPAPPDEPAEPATPAGEPTEPAAAPPGEAAELPPTGVQIAAAAEVLVAKRTRGQIAAAVVWNAMIAIAVLLTLAAIVLTIAGILGAKL